MLPYDHIALEWGGEGTAMAKSTDYRALTFSIIGAGLTWVGVTGLVVGPNMGTAALLSLMCVIVGVDSLAFALWRARYSRPSASGRSARS